METKRYYSLPAEEGKPALAAGLVWVGGHPRMQLAMSLKETGGLVRHLTPEEVLNLKAACNRFLSGVGGHTPISVL